MHREEVSPSIAARAQPAVAAHREALGLQTEAAGAGSELWVWLAQRITAVLALATVGAHFWVLHFALLEQGITASSVATRLHTPFFVVLDLALLAAVLFHALNGLRTVLLDYDQGQRMEPGLTWALVMVGLATLAFGVFALAPFLAGPPPA